jgi:4-amino-4-deoxy-L-arabinose transferase-like glycosyltransferase
VNLVQNGIYGYQIAPSSFISASFLTTSYPVIYPIAISFAVFGISLLHARIVMILFMIALCVAVYLLMRIQAGQRKYLAALSLLCLVTFAPFYGHGKNVLGEVPGVAFLAVSLLLLCLLEKAKKKEWLMFASGIFAGLAMATKPIFLILALPAAFITLCILYRKESTVLQKVLFLLGALGPILVWYLVQIYPNSFLTILSSGNPDHVSIFTIIKGDIALFLKIEPLYFFCIMFIWMVSIVIRKKAGGAILLVESFALIFTILNFVSFFTTKGYYRYFFPGEALALVFLPISIFAIFDICAKRYPKIKSVFAVYLLILICAFQAYQTFFHSWISQSQSSHRAELLAENIGALPADKNIFLYNVPEAVIFLPHHNFYQYLYFAENVQFGEENFSLLWKGKPDFLLVDGKFPYTDKITNVYRERSSFDKYILYEKITK